MRILLKIAAFVAICLTFANAQCQVRCIVMHCGMDQDSSLPPCHRHHKSETHACAQPSALDASGPAGQPYLLAAAGFADRPIGFPAGRPQLIYEAGLPHTPPPKMLPLRI